MIASSNKLIGDGWRATTREVGAADGPGGRALVVNAVDTDAADFRARRPATTGSLEVASYTGFTPGSLSWRPAIAKIAALNPVEVEFAVTSQGEVRVAS